MNNNIVLSKKTQKKMEELHSDLKILFNEVSKYYDFEIINATIKQKEQDKKYEEGKTIYKWPESKHNSKPSLAVDVRLKLGRFGIKKAIYFSGFIMGIAKMLKENKKMRFNLRWGNSKSDYASNLNNGITIEDLMHFEIE